MGSQLVWNERYNVGVDVIDKEHKKLFGIINRLLEFQEQEGKSQWICEEGVKYFKSHAMKHFAEEEVYMASIGYEGYEAHRRLHDDFRQKTLPTLERELRKTEYSAEAIDHFLGVCTGWLIGHTLTEDRAITGKAMSQWTGLLSEEEHIAMQKAIDQIVYDLFQLNVSVISESYGGEKFGKGIYYRLVYGTEEGKKWETILVFEEKLLMNTMGSIMGDKSDKLNTMMLNAVRYTARQFVTRIGERFPSMSMYDLKEENLLTYDQFHQVFRRKHLQFSFLFSTAAGYFAYCLFAPHLLENGVGTPIIADNAMSEVREYLSKREVSQKKKILVVDDSAMILQTMQDLLGGDYEVATVNSGMSAVRSLAVNRPDLILLDYEMPVCDGKQVLEMIRSEEDFVNIPVIFLTGKGDVESIRSVMSLKPAGYLLKSLNPVEIKKNIDQYFQGKGC